MARRTAPTSSRPSAAGIYLFCASVNNTVSQTKSLKQGVVWGHPHTHVAVHKDTGRRLPTQINSRLGFSWQTPSSRDSLLQSHGELANCLFARSEVSPGEIWNWPLYIYSARRHLSGKSYRSWLVAGLMNKWIYLLKRFVFKIKIKIKRFVFSSRKANRSPGLPARIFNVYIKVFMGFGHIYFQMASGTYYSLKIPSLKSPILGSGRTHTPRTGASNCQVWLPGQLAVMPSWWPFLTIGERIPLLVCFLFSLSVGSMGITGNN